LAGDLKRGSAVNFKRKKVLLCKLRSTRKSRSISKGKDQTVSEEDQHYGEGKGTSYEGERKIQITCNSEERISTGRKGKAFQAFERT